MVVMIYTSLMCMCRVEGDRFVDIGIAIPNAITRKVAIRSSVAFIRITVRKSISAIKHTDTVNEISDDAIASCGFRNRGCARVTWETKNGRCITRVVGKKVGSILIKIPRSHDVEA